MVTMVSTGTRTMASSSNVKRITTYHCREIGEGGWRQCTKEWYDHCSKDPHMDTKVVIA